MTNAKRDRVVAIGETGLDFTTTPMQKLSRSS